MATWKIAGVQMDCRLGEPRHNLEVVRSELRRAAGQGARLVVFPECVLTGYAFDCREEAWPLAQTLPGPPAATGSTSVVPGAAASGHESATTATA